MNNFANKNAMSLAELTSLETELHKDETCRNHQRMETLLHADFVEFGRSARRYTRSEILDEFALDNVLPAVHARHFDFIFIPAAQRS